MHPILCADRANVGEHQSDDEDDDEEELQAQEYIQRTFDPALPRMRKTCQGRYLYNNMFE